MAGGGRRFGLVGQLDRAAGDLDAADHEAVGMGVVQDALAGAEQILDQIAVAQLVVGDDLHHVGVCGVVCAVEHRRSPG